MSTQSTVTASSTTTTDDNMVEYKLEAFSELRFEVEAEVVECELKVGLAEMFGTELTKSHRYKFNCGSKVAIFTYHGCTLELYGKPEVAYISKDTPMMFYANFNAGLENIRQSAQEEDINGPIVMIVGPTDVGKSTLCRILLNYSVRLGRTPIFIDLDPGQGSVSIPGSMGAVIVERPADIEEGFSLIAPIVYHFGHTGPAGNVTLYNMIIKAIAQIVQQKMDCDKKVKYSGVIINTCGWVKSFGYKAIIQAAQDFSVDVIAVLDQERLYNELVRDIDEPIKILLTPKSGGVVERTRQFRVEARDARVRWYFYGSLKSSLYPHSVEVPFSQIKIYKIGAPNLPDSCMPIGMKTEDPLTKLVIIQPSAQQLLNHLLAVSTATSAEDNVKVLESNIFGFVCVTNVDTDRQMVTLLSPQSRSTLPLSSVFLISEIQFLDSH